MHYILELDYLRSRTSDGILTSRKNIFYIDSGGHSTSIPEPT